MCPPPSPSGPLNSEARPATPKDGPESRLAGHRAPASEGILTNAITQFVQLRTFVISVRARSTARVKASPRSPSADLLRNNYWAARHAGEKRDQLPAQSHSPNVHPLLGAYAKSQGSDVGAESQEIASHGLERDGVHGETLVRTGQWQVDGLFDKAKL